MYYKKSNNYLHKLSKEGMLPIVQVANGVVFPLVRLLWPGRRAHQLAAWILHEICKAQQKVAQHFDTNNNNLVLPNPS